MAGDWMKVELELPDKPEVHAIAALTNLDPDAVVGKLLRIWQWFDKHTTNGNADGVTLTLLDRNAGVAGFGDAMCKAGWMVQHDGGGLTMPKFDRHTSESAKARALSAKRQSKHRAKSNADSNADSNAAIVTQSLPREENRREDKEPKTTTTAARFDFLKALTDNGVDQVVARDYIATRKAKKCVQTETAFRLLVAESGKAGLSLADAVAVCCKRGWGGFEAAWIKPEDRPQPAKPAYVMPEFMRRAI